MVRHREGVDPHALARLANELALRCPPSDRAFSVGAVIASPEGEVLGTGFSRETGARDHAEEAALAAARAAGHELAGMQVYVSLEPCGHRASKPKSCALLLIEVGISRVYYTAREPPVFLVQNGIDRLTIAGVECIEIPGFDEAFRRANAHLLGRLGGSSGR